MPRDSRTHPVDVHNARPPLLPPRNGRAVPLEPSLRRAVLATDGTVTNLIESFLEPVAVKKLAEEHAVAPLPEWPELPPGTLVIRRTVVIKGAGSGRIFLHAESLLVLDRLTPTVQHELQATAKPIGKLIQEHRIESYRELMGAVTEAAGPRAAALGIDPAEMLVARTYRIHLGGQPAIQITERFLT